MTIVLSQPTRTISLPLLALLMSICLSFSLGCDKLVTEVNNETVWDSTLANDCLRCHSDNNNRILLPKAQWENSKHASPDLLFSLTYLNDSAFDVAECGARCHTNEGYIDWLKSGDTTGTSMPTVIGCFTCHMPHTGNYGSWSIDTLRGDTDEIMLADSSIYDIGKSNMCAHCHQARRPVLSPQDSLGVILTADWGPHFSCQADVLNGTGGYRRMDTTIASSHSALTFANHNGCLACHYGTGQGYLFGEHTFRLEDDMGTPYVANCNVEGCHDGNPPAVVEFYPDNSIIDSIETVAVQLRRHFQSESVLLRSDPDGIKFNVGIELSHLEAKALYNYLLYKLDGSKGIHNPTYMLALLTESLFDVTTSETYQKQQ